MYIGMCPGHVNRRPLHPAAHIHNAILKAAFPATSMLKIFCAVYAALVCLTLQATAQGTPKWMKPPSEQSSIFGSSLGKPLGAGGSAILSTKGSEVMSPVPVPSTLFGLHATDQTSAESPFAGPTQFAYGAPHEMRMKDPYPAPHQPTVSNPEYRRIHNLSFLAQKR